MYDNEKEKRLASTITDVLNPGINKRAFCEAMSREHRYLQDDFTDLCIWWLEKCRDMYEEGNYDDRNKHGCRIGKILMDYYDKWGDAV